MYNNWYVHLLSSCGRYDICSLRFITYVTILHRSSVIEGRTARVTASSGDDTLIKLIFGGWIYRETLVEGGEGGWAKKGHQFSEDDD